MVAIKRQRGDTKPIKFKLNDSDGAAIDITSYTFILTVDPSEAPADAVNNLFALTGTITGALAGEFEFPITAVQADEVGEFFYDVEITDGAGDTESSVPDAFVFTQDITK